MLQNECRRPVLCKQFSWHPLNSAFTLNDSRGFYQLQDGGRRKARGFPRNAQRLGENRGSINTTLNFCPFLLPPVFFFAASLFVNVSLFLALLSSLSTGLCKEFYESRSLSAFPCHFLSYAEPTKAWSNTTHRKTEETKKHSSQVDQYLEGCHFSGRNQKGQREDEMCLKYYLGRWISNNNLWVGSDLTGSPDSPSGCCGRDQHPGRGQD